MPSGSQATRPIPGRPKTARPKPERPRTARPIPVLPKAEGVNDQLHEIIGNAFANKYFIQKAFRKSSVGATRETERNMSMQFHN